MDSNSSDNKNQIWIYPHNYHIKTDFDFGYPYAHFYGFEFRIFGYLFSTCHPSVASVKTKKEAQSMAAVKSRWPTRVRCTCASA